MVFKQQVISRYSRHCFSLFVSCILCFLFHSDIGMWFSFIITQCINKQLSLIGVPQKTNDYNNCSNKIKF